MRRKRSLASVLFELAAVLLITIAAFAWGVKTARIERGYEAIGGGDPPPPPPAIFFTRQRARVGWITHPPGITKRRD